MQLGWIDFSKNERDKVLDVLDSLTVQGTLDELGIAPVSDAFADTFFPGTSTLHTHAKYYLLIPYACKDLERADAMTPQAAYDRLYATERKTAELLRAAHPNELGIIGGDYKGREKWIKRPPSTLYWAGLRRYKIFDGRQSTYEYIKAVCALKRDKDALKKLGNRNDEDGDDRDAGMLATDRFFTLPTYTPDWQNGLSLRLTPAEAKFLKEKICGNASDSLLAYVLDGKCPEFFACESFDALPAVIADPKLKADCEAAVAFSDFVYVLRVLYNRLVSNGENAEANGRFDELCGKLTEYSNIDVDNMFLRLRVRHDALRTFLKNTKAAMSAGDVAALEELIKKREKDIKGKDRAKTITGTKTPDKWIGGRRLDFRFWQAKRMLGEIVDGEAGNV